MRGLRGRSRTRGEKRCCRVERHDYLMHSARWMNKEDTGVLWNVQKDNDERDKEGRDGEKDRRGEGLGVTRFSQFSPRAFGRNSVKSTCFLLLSRLRQTHVRLPAIFLCSSTTSGSLQRPGSSARSRSPASLYGVTPADDQL